MVPDDCLDSWNFGARQDPKLEIMHGNGRQDNDLVSVETKEKFSVP